MTIKNKTPTARAAARSYCRRCLAVMLCCVLVFGMTVRTAPRAEAVVAEGTAALAVGGGSFAAAPVAGTLGLLLLTVCGVDIAAGYVHAEDSVFYGTRGYDIGANLWDDLYNAGPDFAAWLMDVTGYYEDKGGVAPGDSITVPPEIAAAVRSWAVEHIDFTDGRAVYTDRGIFTSDAQIIFTPYPSEYSYNKVPVGAVSLGTVVPYGESFSFSVTDEAGTPWEIKMYMGDTDGTLEDTQFCDFYRDGERLKHISCAAYNLFFHLREEKSAYYLCVGWWNSKTGALDFHGYAESVSALAQRYCNLDVATISDLTTTLTRNPALDEDTTQDLVIAIPGDVPTQRVGKVTVPVFGDLTLDDLLNPGLDKPDTGVDDPAVPGISAGEISDAIADALPVTGAVAGDAVVGEAMAEPDSLGAVFISKFPFSIPWDVGRAIKLLAAPPVTPRWELDFMAPIAYRVGGFKGDTTVVLDFSDYEIIGQVTRWVSTLMFVYALATGTKRLIWTA